jgi:hypothetical protein
MVSLLVTAIGYQLNHARDSQHAYKRLARCGYLSARALLNREAVIALIARTESEFIEQHVGAAVPDLVRFGDEPWRHIDGALEDAGYLSWIGLTLGRRFVHRRWGGWI